MDSNRIYAATIERLKRSIEQHPTPLNRSSVRAFAEAYGYHRENLRQVLNQEQDVSVSLFMKLAARLDNQPEPELPPALERWSLRTWLQIATDPIQLAMYQVCFRD